MLVSLDNCTRNEDDYSIGFLLNDKLWLHKTSELEKTSPVNWNQRGHGNMTFHLS